MIGEPWGDGRTKGVAPSGLSEKKRGLGLFPGADAPGYPPVAARAAEPHVMLAELAQIPDALGRASRGTRGQCKTCPATLPATKPQWPSCTCFPVSTFFTETKLPLGSNVNT